MGTIIANSIHTSNSNLRIQTLLNKRYAARMRISDSQIAELRRQNLLLLRTKFRLTFAEIAKRTDTNAQYLSQIANRQIQKRGKNPRAMSNDYAAKIEIGLGLPNNWMDQPHPDLLENSEITSIEQLAQTIGDHGIPIIGSTITGPDMDWIKTDVPSHPIQQFIDFPNKKYTAYGLMVEGCQFEPRLHAGETVLVYRNKPYAPGDECVICTKDQKILIKRILYIKKNHVAIEDLSCQHRRFISLDEFEFIHPIAAIILI